MLKESNMDIIDQVVYTYKEHHERDEVLSAYQELFKDSMVTKIVLQDLIRLSNYATTALVQDTNNQYYIRGMQVIIQTIKNALNTPIMENSRLPTDVNGNIEEGE